MNDLSKVFPAIFDKQAALYFEAHVTIEPIFDDRLERAKQIAIKNGFKIASLLMKKRSEDTAERSQYDTFMTGHGKSYLDLTTNMITLIRDLHIAGFKVWRYKMEDTLYDSRSRDILGLLRTEDQTWQQNKSAESETKSQGCAEHLI